MERKSGKQIIEALANDEKVKQAAKKIGGRDWEDVHQELFVVLCMTDESKIEQMETSGYLHFWVVRTMMNIASGTGKDYLYKRYTVNVEGQAEERVAGEEQAEESDLIFIRQREVVEDILTELEAKGRTEFSWYKVNLLRLYAETQNYSEISKLTGIPFGTIHNDLTLFRRELAAIINQRI